MKTPSLAHHFDIYDLEKAMRASEVEYSSAETTLFLFLATSMLETETQEWAGTVSEMAVFFEMTTLEMGKTVKSLIDKDLILVRQMVDPKTGNQAFAFSLSVRASKILLKDKRGGEYVH